MNPVYRQYTEELHDKFGYLATWLPNTKLKLGDVGFLKRDRFELITTIDDLGLHTQSRDIGGAADYQYISSEGASINFDVSGAAPTAVGPITHSAAAKVSVVFARANAVVFLATGCKTVSIERHDILGRTILERFKAGSWDKDYVVITELVTASSATILISATDSAQVDLDSKATVAATGLSLADVNAGFTIRSSSGVATQILAASEITPLFRASAIRRHIFSSPSFDTRSGISTPRNENEDVFGDIDYRDLE